MVWALVKENEIVNVGYLPKKLSGIPEPQLKENGWYRVIKDETIVEDWQTSNSSYVYNSVEDNVTETKNITDMSLDDYKNKRYYEEIAKEIHTYILSQYPEYKQLSALAGYYDTATNDSIVNGVKVYFDKAQVIKIDLFGYTTYEEVRDIYFRQPVYDVDGITIIGYNFWGD